MIRFRRCDSGVEYCTAHDGIREADEARCDFDDGLTPCQCVPLLYDVVPSWWLRVRGFFARLRRRLP